MKWILLLMLICSYPISKNLPPYWGWENGPIELTQDFVLVIGMLLALKKAYEFYQIQDVLNARFFAWTTPVWLLLLGRELSWGRVLFPTGTGAGGPEFIPMSEYRYAFAIHILISLIILLFVVAVVKYKLYKAPLNWVNSGVFPVHEVGLLIFAGIVATIAERGLHFPILEEFTETIVYLSLVAAVIKVRVKRDGLGKIILKA